MSKKLYTIASVLLLLVLAEFAVVCPNSFCSPVSTNNNGLLRLPAPQRPENISALSGKKIFRSQKSMTGIQATPSLDFENNLAGTWDNVLGLVGFWHTFEDGLTLFVSIVGLPAQNQGPGNYTTTGWDKKVFWFDVGDGIPMHLSAVYIGYYLDDDTGETVRVFNAHNLFFIREGVDYSEYEDGSQFLSMYIYTDTENNVLGYEMDLYGPDYETVLETTQFRLGDRVLPWTLAIQLNDPGYIYLATIEENFRVVTQEPKFFYVHWTPNKDFPNPITLDKVDFSNIDLHYLLVGIADGINGDPDRYSYSQAKDANVKWDAQQTSGFWNWLFMK